MSTLPGSVIDRLRFDAGEMLDEYKGQSAGEYGCWPHDPVGFTRHYGGDPTDYQQEVMESVIQNKFTGWAACHSAGKEWTGGRLAAWGAAHGMLVLCVSATELQVVGQLMREVRATCRAVGLPHQAFTRSIRIGGEDRIIALTGGASVDALTGWHDPGGVLLIVSEGQYEQLEASVYEAILALATDDRCRVLVMGNPIHTTGPFAEILRRKHWNPIHTSAFQTPNCRAGKLVRSGFPSHTWPSEVARERGINSAYYQSRVLGQIPDQDESALISLESWEAAQDPERAREELDTLYELQRSGEAAPAVVSADIAREGSDQTALIVRWGSVLFELIRWREPDTVENARRILELVKRLLNEDKIPIGSVIVDEVAVGGGVLDQLERLLQGVGWHQVRLGGYRPDLYWIAVEAVGFKASRRAPSASRFSDSRSQSYWHMRDQFAAGSIVFHPRLDGELLLDLKREVLAHDFRHEGDDRIRILKKDEIRARLGGRSPDLADALTMTYALDLRSDKKKRVLRFA